MLGQRPGHSATVQAPHPCSLPCRNHRRAPYPLSMHFYQSVIRDDSYLRGTAKYLAPGSTGTFELEAPASSFKTERSESSSRLSSAAPSAAPRMSHRQMGHSSHVATGNSRQRCCSKGPKCVAWGGGAVGVEVVSKEADGALLARGYGELQAAVLRQGA